MNRYPTAETSVTQLFKQSFRLHYLTLKHTIFFILLMTIVKYIAAIFTLFVSNEIARTILFFFATLAGIYLFSAALLATHESFMDRSKSFTDILTVIKKNVVNIYSTLFIYIVGIICTWYVAKLLNFSIEKMLGSYFSAVHGFTFILSVTLILMFIAMFFFSYPLVVLEAKKIKNVFYESLILSDKNKFGIFVLLFLLLATDMLISPVSLQEYFLSRYHLGVLFDFVALCVMLPLFINLLLLTIHDAKLQLMIEER